MTSPNPMALEAKALEAAKLERLLRKWAVTVENETLDGQLPGNEAVNELWLVALDAADFLAALPLPAAGEGLEPAYVPQVIEYEQGGFTELVIEDTATITGDEVVVRVIRRMAEPRDIIGFQWDAPGPPLYAATPAARAAVLEATPANIKSMAQELCSFRGDNAHSVDRGGVEKWEDYKPLAAAALREANRLAALKEKT